MWPPGFYPVAERASMYSKAARDAEDQAFETRQPSAHAKASQLHLAAAAAHKVAAQHLGTQMRGTVQAGQLAEHQARMQQHVHDAAFHRQEAEKPVAPPVGNPKLTYGVPKEKLGYGPGAPPG